MNKSKRSLYFGQIVWIIGLIVLVALSLNVEDYLNQVASETYNPFALYWYYSLDSFIFGIYISIFFVKKWSFNVNTPLLCFVFIPSLLITCCSLILMMINGWGISIAYIPYWLIRISQVEVFGIVAGMTLMLGIFTNQLDIGEKTVNNSVHI